MKKEAVRQQDSLIFEGMTSLNAVYHSASREIIKIWADETKKGSKHREFAFISKICKEKDLPLELCDTAVIDSLATGTSHGGVIFECGERQIPSVEEISFDNTTDGIKDFFVMIEGIEDPYNFGYALRSLYAAGVSGVILSPRNWMSAAGVVCRSSAGASERLPMYVGEALDAVNLFRNKGFKVICAGIRDSVSSWECDMTPPVLLIVGGEKRGISSKILSLADSVVRLEYGRDYNGSLSAASAASILAYDVLRQVKTGK